MTLTTRLAIAMILLVAVAVSAVGWLSYRALEQALLPRILDRIETNGRLVASDLQSYVRGARADVKTFSARAAARGMATAHFGGGIDPVDHISEGTWRDRLTTQLTAELQAKPNYAQFRVIGIEDGGREVVRVDRSGPNGAIRVVPDFELQRKGDRPYFKRTIQLPADGISVSPIDLNQEYGALAVPYVPTIRVSGPFYTPDGRLYGIVIIDVDLRAALDRIRATARNGEMIYV